MATKGKAQASTQAGTQPTLCVYCGKTLKKAGAVKAGHGARCAAMQKAKTPQQWQAHYKKISVAVTPPNFITVGALDKVVRAQAHNVAGLTISKMVKAFGTDKAATPPVNPIMQVYYLPNKHRVIHQWAGTQAGLQAIATGNFGSAPNAPKVQTI